MKRTTSRVVNWNVVLLAFTSKKLPRTVSCFASQAPIPALDELVASAASGLVRSRVLSTWNVMPCGAKGAPMVSTYQAPTMLLLAAAPAGLTRYTKLTTRAAINAMETIGKYLRLIMVDHSFTSFA